MLSLLRSWIGLSPKSAFKVTIHGFVRDGGFPFHVERVVRSHRLNGRISVISSNLMEVELEGDRNSLERCLAALEKVPPLARIQTIRTQWTAHTGRHKFLQIKG